VTYASDTTFASEETDRKQRDSGSGGGRDGGVGGVLGRGGGGKSEMTDGMDEQAEEGGEVLSLANMWGGETRAVEIVENVKEKGQQRIVNHGSVEEAEEQRKDQPTTHYNTLQHTATRCSTLRHTANALEADGTERDLGQMLCNKPQYSATHCSTFQHTTNDLEADANGEQMHGGSCQEQMHGGSWEKDREDAGSVGVGRGRWSKAFDPESGVCMGMSFTSSLYLFFDFSRALLVLVSCSCTLCCHSD